MRDIQSMKKISIMDKGLSALNDSDPINAFALFENPLKIQFVDRRLFYCSLKF